MDMIYYRGLNCHVACVINIANAFGINYENAFHSLWSETDFIDDTKYRIYKSRRLLPNLEALGAKIEVLSCKSNKEKEKSFSMISNGEHFLIGIDTFYIPWSLVYKHFHGHHYIFALKDSKKSIYCFDPTYDKKIPHISVADIIPYAFDLNKIHKINVNPPKISLSCEAWEILSNHTKTQKKLGDEILKCQDKEWKSIEALIKQITAMINNRYLFYHFLHQYSYLFNNKQLFSDKHFSKWEAVKNGLYKTYIAKNNENVVNEVYNLFLNLISEEMDIAQEIIMAKHSFCL